MCGRDQGNCQTSEEKKTVSGKTGGILKGGPSLYQVRPQWQLLPLESDSPTLGVMTTTSATPSFSDAFSDLGVDDDQRMMKTTSATPPGPLRVVVNDEDSPKLYGAAAHEPNLEYGHKRL